MKSLEEQLKVLIIDALVLEDVAPEDIDPAAPLFVEGLGLDSIDALELAMALDKEFGIKLDADDENNRKIFASIDALAAFVRQRQQEKEGRASG